MNGRLILASILLVLISGCSKSEITSYVIADSDRACISPTQCTAFFESSDTCSLTAVNLQAASAYGGVKKTVSCSLEDVRVDCENNFCVLVSSEKGIRPQENQSCIASGGFWLRLSNPGPFRCYFKTGDSGKNCTDSSQCEGRCFSPGKCSELKPLPLCGNLMTSGIERMHACSQYQGH